MCRFVELAKITFKNIYSTFTFRLAEQPSNVTEKMAIALLTIISLYWHILITFHKIQYPSQPVPRAENKGNYGGLKSRYPGIHPKLICLSCQSNLFKCCLAPLRILLKRQYWDTCVNSLNINHLLFTFFVSFVTGERKQHVVCVCTRVC